MSLLLKALEKSEEEKQQGEGQGATPTPPAGGPSPEKPGGGGFKLGAAGPAGASKLGSALGSAEAKTAQRVVMAHEAEPGAGADEADALVAASRKSLIKNVTMAGIVVVVLGGAWFAWQEFGSRFFGTQQQGEVAEATEQAPATQQDLEADVNLLPLSEPIFDIQESISLTSAALAPGSDGSAAEENVQSQMAEMVETIIESQLDKQRSFIEEQRKIIALERGEADTLQAEVQEALAGDFDVANAEQVDPYKDMIAKLEEISTTPFVSRGGNQFVKPAGFDMALLDESNVADDAGSAENGNGAQQAATTKKPEEVMVLAKSDKNLKTVFDDAMASYAAGDLNHAEKSFRTVLAAEPRNTSALVGLAKVHYGRGNIRIAVATLLKAADIAPNDPIVISELISIQSGSADPLISESRIFSLLGRNQSPEVEARLRFLLGNSYAKQGRWFQAKQAFMIAHGLDQNNPDFAYNLAVILDYLNDPSNALRMYKTALSSAAATPSSFDHQAARNRVEVLSRN